MRNVSTLCSLTGLVLGGFVGLASERCSAGQAWPASPTVEPVMDQSPQFLEPPRDLKLPSDVTIASNPPRVTFSTVTGLEPVTEEMNGVWTVFGEGVAGTNGMFYVAFGNNAAIDGNSVVYEYNPNTHEHRRVLDVGWLIGQKPGDFGHGKLHGRLDQMPDGWIYMATYCSIDSDQLERQERARVGSRLLAYNALTGQAKDLGMPVLGETYPMNGTDTRRGIFHGIGLLGGYMAIDLAEKRVLYQGELPGDIRWGQRATLIDPKTGKCYGSDPETRQIVCYDPNSNRFSQTEAYIPEHPIRGKEENPTIRTYTRCRLPDGSFMCHTADGVMFKFYPDEETTELIGLNWLDGCYCTSQAVSSDGRYIYYSVGLHTTTVEGGPPIIQYDVKTKRRKVIGFVQPFYGEKLGYVFGTSYSISLSIDDANLLLAWNGCLRDPIDDCNGIGQPAFTYVEIPTEERTAETGKK